MCIIKSLLLLLLFRLSSYYVNIHHHDYYFVDAFNVNSSTNTSNTKRMSLLLLQRNSNNNVIHYFLNKRIDMYNDVTIRIPMCLSLSAASSSSTSNNNNNNNNNNSNESMADKIKKAMNLSTHGQSNITQAYLAISLWEDILPYNTENNTNNNSNDDDKIQNTLLPIPITKICSALYAATLVRVGRDDDALVVYNDILENMVEVENIDKNENEDMILLSSTSNNENKIIKISDLSLWIDISISQGETLQRLMKYDQARNRFGQVWSTLLHLQTSLSSTTSSSTTIDIVESFIHKQSQCAYKTALCSLRLDDLEYAEHVLLQEYNHVQQRLKCNGMNNNHDDDTSICNDVMGMLGIVQIEKQMRETGRIDYDYASNSIELVKDAAGSNNSSGIYKWLYEHLIKSRSSSSTNDFSNEVDKKIQYLKMSFINNSPYDDTFLRHLDDKVLLHQLLTDSNENNSNTSFWPIGFILPNDQREFEQHCSIHDNKKLDDCKDWIIKKRSGYGSHGNTIVSAKEAMKMSSMLYDQVLCQELIKSTTCQGRRFSLRIYVVYFQSYPTLSSSVYISKTGLMKLASCESNIPLNVSENDIYMTNSGRGDVSNENQYDFDYLAKFIDDKYGSGHFNELWSKIELSVSSVMKSYLKKKESLLSPSNAYSNTLFGNIPKVMGFDYLLIKDYKDLLQPRLIEVNRFPGLEARGSTDESVKMNLIKDVWSLASGRANTKTKGTNDAHKSLTMIKI